MINPYTGTVRNPPPTAKEGGLNEFGQAIRSGFKSRKQYLFACPCGKALQVSGAQLNAGKVRCHTHCKGRIREEGSRICPTHGMSSSSNKPIEYNCYTQDYGCWVNARWQPSMLVMNIGENFRIQVVSAVIISDHSILLARRKQGTPFALCWETPGGKVERGETKGAALVREIKEELAVDCNVGREIGSIALDPPVVPTPLRVTFYRTEIHGKPKAMASDALRLYRAEELDELPLMPANRALLDLVIQEMRG